MNTNELHEAALQVAIRKRLIRLEETYAYPVDEARTTNTSYVLVSKRYGTSHRLLLADVQSYIDKQASREEKEKLAEASERVKQAFALAEEETLKKRQTFIKRVEQLNPLGGRFSFWGGSCIW